MRSHTRGFGIGAGAGAVLAALALAFAVPVGTVDVLDIQSLLDGDAAEWVLMNLGHSVWLFVSVLGLYTLHLRKLTGLLRSAPAERQVAALDQLIDVWTQLFIGIGVIWTAIGMRSALQAAIGDPSAALGDSAGNVLQRLVDGGILLALTTTIVGGIGGYLMRLGKTVLAGAQLHEFYESLARADSLALLEKLTRIEAILSDQTTNRGEPSGEDMI